MRLVPPPQEGREGLPGRPVSPRGTPRASARRPWSPAAATLPIPFSTSSRISAQFSLGSMLHPAPRFILCKDTATGVLRDAHGPWLGSPTARPGAPHGWALLPPHWSSPWCVRMAMSMLLTPCVCVSHAADPGVGRYHVHWSPELCARNATARPEASAATTRVSRRAPSAPQATGARSVGAWDRPGMCVPCVSPRHRPRAEHGARRPRSRRGPCTRRRGERGPAAAHGRSPNAGVLTPLLRSPHPRGARSGGSVRVLLKGRNL